MLCPSSTFTEAVISSPEATTQSIIDSHFEEQAIQQHTTMIIIMKLRREKQSQYIPITFPIFLFPFFYPSIFLRLIRSLNKAKTCNCLLRSDHDDQHLFVSFTWTELFPLRYKKKLRSCKLSSRKIVRVHNELIDSSQKKARKVSVFKRFVIKLVLCDNETESPRGNIFSNGLDDLSIHLLFYAESFNSNKDDKNFLWIWIWYLRA